MKRAKRWIARGLPWTFAIVHAALFLWMLADKPFQPYPGPAPPGALSFSSWHMATGMMVAGRDLHHDTIGMALFVADLPVLVVIGVASFLLDDAGMSPMVASYVWGAVWLVGGSCWWFALMRLALRRWR